MEEALSSIQMIWARKKNWDPAMSVRFPILNSTISIKSGLELFLVGDFFLRIVTTMGFIAISHFGYVFSCSKHLKQISDFHQVVSCSSRTTDEFGRRSPSCVE